ncbi:MAG: PEP-CTERM sorting domain-containing protein [Leptolyngbyaceae cyanobacterium]
MKTPEPDALVASRERMPEPTTLLGAMVALGAGYGLKRRRDQETAEGLKGDRALIQRVSNACKSLTIQRSRGFELSTSEG